METTEEKKNKEEARAKAEQLRGDGFYDRLYALSSFSAARSEQTDGEVTQQILGMDVGGQLLESLDRLDAMSPKTRATVKLWFDTARQYVLMRDMLDNLEERLAGDAEVNDVVEGCPLRVEKK